MSGKILGNDKGIYTFNNFAPKYIKILMWTVIAACLVIYTVYCCTRISAVLVVIPITIVMGFIFYYKLPLKDFYYSAIVVNNRDRVLEIVTKNGDKEQFKYDEILAITSMTEPEPMKRRCLINIDILLKAGTVRSVTFTNLEFGLDFLDKLPPSVNYTKPERSPFFYLVVFCLIIVWGVCGYGMIRALCEILTK